MFWTIVGALLFVAALPYIIAGIIIGVTALFHFVVAACKLAWKVFVKLTADIRKQPKGYAFLAITLGVWFAFGIGWGIALAIFFLAVISNQPKHKKPAELVKQIETDKGKAS